MDKKDDYVVVAYGDSITKGVIYDTDKSKYSTLKDSFINLVSKNINGSVYNAGKFGSTIVRGINKMYADVVNKSPDIVLIEFGGNDCDFNWTEVANHPEIEHVPNTDLKTFKTTLLTLVSKLKNDNVIPALMTLPPLDPLKYFKWIGKGDLLAEKNILNWLGTKDTLFTWHASYNDIIKEVASSTNTVLIDVRTEFLKCTNYSDFLCLDGIHPNTMGHKLIANTLLSFLRDNYNYLLQK